MKRRLCFLLAVLMMIGFSPVIAEEDSFLNSAGKFFGDTWNSVSGAASDAWDTASEATGNALDSAGDAIDQAWIDISGIAADAWGKASVYLGEKSEEFSVWMSISGNDALEKLKEAYDEYLVYYRDAGLRVKTVYGRTALVPDGLDLDYISELADGRKVSNLTRMLEGYAPLDPLTGKAYQLHHVGQRVNGTLAVLTEAQHQGNAAILNMVGKASEINRTAFSTTRKEFWMSFGKILANS